MRGRVAQRTFGLIDVARVDPSRYQVRDHDVGREIAVSAKFEHDVVPTVPEDNERSFRTPGDWARSAEATPLTWDATYREWTRVTGP